MTQSCNRPERGESNDALLLDALRNENVRLERLLAIAVKKAGGRVVVDDDDLMEPIGLDVDEQPDETVLTTILAH